MTESNPHPLHSPFLNFQGSASHVTPHVTAPEFCHPKRSPLPTIKYIQPPPHALAQSPGISTPPPTPSLISTISVVTAFATPEHNGSHRYFDHEPPVLFLSSIDPSPSNAKAPPSRNLRSLRRRQIHPPQTPLCRPPQHFRLFCLSLVLLQPAASLLLPLFLPLTAGGRYDTIAPPG